MLTYLIFLQTKGVAHCFNIGWMFRFLWISWYLNSRIAQKIVLWEIHSLPKKKKKPWNTGRFKKLPLMCSREEIEEMCRGCASHCLSLLFIFVSFVTKVFLPLRDAFELIRRSARHELPHCGAVSHCHFCVQTVAASVGVYWIYLYEASKVTLEGAASFSTLNVC